MSSGGFFESVKVGDLIKGQTPVVISSTDSVESACSILIKNAISSAPVYDSLLQKYVGMFDFRDLVDYVLLISQKDTTESIPENEEAIHYVVSTAHSLKHSTAEIASDLSHKNPFVSIDPSAFLSDALEVLGRHGIHRVNVIDRENNHKVLGILSQSDIIKYLGGKPEELTRITQNKSLEQLGFVDPARNIVKVDSNTPVIEALGEMSKRGITSIAIVSGSMGTTLLGSISMTDIKYIFKFSRFSRLKLSCGKFLSVILTNQGLENGGIDRVPVLDVKATATLTYAVQKIVATRTHRLWIVDERGDLCGVISLTDILRYLNNKQ